MKKRNFKAIYLRKNYICDYLRGTCKVDYNEIADFSQFFTDRKIDKLNKYGYPKKITLIDGSSKVEYEFLGIEKKGVKHDN